MKQETTYDQWLLPDDETTVLPSGLPCILRNPSGEYFLRIGALPGGKIAEAVSQNTEVSTLLDEAKQQQEAEMLAKSAPDAAWSEDEITRWRDATHKSWLLAVDIFVKPVFSMDPKPGEFHPRRLQLHDRVFIQQWADKRMIAMYKGGRADVETFHPEQGPSAVADGGGEKVQETAG